MAQPFTNYDSAHFEQLCFACKTGNLELARSLVSNYAVPINQEDRWQCVPLYYACFGGHYDLCKFLLESGATCDPHTFQGERCLYGALTDKVRQLLREHRLSKSVSETRPFLAFMSQLLAQASTGKSYPDLCIRVVDFSSDELPYRESVHWAHRMILAARSTWFDEIITKHATPITKHNTSLNDHVDLVWELRFPMKNMSDDQLKVPQYSMLELPAVHPDCLKAILHYIYTGDTIVRPQSTVVGAAVPSSLQQTMLDTCKAMKLNELTFAYNTALETSIAATAEKTAITGATEEQTRKLQLDLEKFVKERIFINDNRAAYEDILINIGGVKYPAHRAFFYTRCDYIKTSMEGEYTRFNSSSLHGDATEDTTINRLEVNMPLLEELGFDGISDETANAVNSALFIFIYTDRCNIPLQALHPTLTIADLLLLDRLRSLAAISITSLPITTVDRVLQEAENQQTAFLLKTSNNSSDSLPFDIYALYRQAAQWKLDRLEQWCVRWFASNLEHVASTDEFRKLVQESAEDIIERQDIDSIILVDEIRYWLRKQYNYEYFEEEEDEDEEYDEGFTQNIANSIINEDNREDGDKQLTNELSLASKEYREYCAKVSLLEQVVTSLGLEA
ncbi:hypothetical protein BDF22DRAFT_694487 [Syncephalis plumigaleata]|nr:hypothetical protein BDF22DRAFT_694487 [Syncephalis plumigaleata]